MNENYVQPAMPKGVEQGILRGMYLLHIGGRGKVRVTLLGSGTILREVLAAAEMLESRLRHPGRRLQRHELLGAAPRRARPRSAGTCCIPGQAARCPRCAHASRAGGTVHRGHRLHEDRRRTRSGSGCPAATSPSAPTASAAATRARRCASTSRSTGAGSCWPRCKALADDGRIDRSSVTLAMKKFGIDPDKPEPLES